MDVRTLWIKHRKTIIVTLLSALSGFLARKVAHVSWEGITDEDPPKNPDDVEVEWKEAVAWTIFASLLAGLFRFIIRREANEHLSHLDA